MMVFRAFLDAARTFVSSCQYVPGVWLPLRNRFFLIVPSVLESFILSVWSSGCLSVPDDLRLAKQTTLLVWSQNQFTNCVPGNVRRVFFSFQGKKVRKRANSE